MGTDGIDRIEHSEILGQAERIMASRWFANALKAKALFKHILYKALAGQEDDLRAIPIAQDLYGKGPAFDGTDRIVNQAAGDLRRRLAGFYADEGRNDPWLIEIPKGGFVPEFTFRNIQPSAQNVASGDLNSGRIRRLTLMWAAPAVVGAVVAIALGAVLGVLPIVHGQQPANANHPVKIKNFTDGAKVHAEEDVVVTGCEAGRSCYLIVAPLDGDRREWVEDQVSGTDATVTANFGDARTKPGMQFRVYVLSTKSELPIGELVKPPDDARKLAAITVTLQK
jgi:hypothetical protein